MNLIKNVKDNIVNLKVFISLNFFFVTLKQEMRKSNRRNNKSKLPSLHGGSLKLHYTPFNNLGKNTILFNFFIHFFQGQAVNHTDKRTRYYLFLI